MDDKYSLRLGLIAANQEMSSVQNEGSSENTLAQCSGMSPERSLKTQLPASVRV
jgi:hypothetical protein